VRVLTIHLIAYWGYLWGVFFLAGFAGLRLVHRFVPRPLHTHRTGDIVWFGVASVTWVGLITSLSLPLADGFHVVLVGALVLYALCDRRALAAFAAQRMMDCRLHGGSLGWRALLAGSLVVAVILYAALGANGAPTVYDTLLYHAQSVRWLKEHGTVPGLANLNSRIGFNNAWFVTAAFVDAGPFTFKSFHVIDSFIYVFTLATLIARLANGIGRPLLIGWLFDTLMLYPLLHYRFTTNSLSTDVVSTMAVVAVVSHFLHRYDSEARRQDDLCWAAVVVPFMVTIKLINLPMLLLPFLAFWAAVSPVRGLRALWTGAPRRRAAGYALLASLLFLPWLVRGYFLSGYLLYPFHSLDLFSPDWKVPLAVATSEQDWIKSWARIPGAQPGDVLGKGIGFWFSGWLSRSQPFIGEFMYWVVSGLVVAALFVRPITQRVARAWPVFLTLVVALSYWFFQAPCVRFGYGYLTVTQVLIAALVLLIALETVAERGRLMLGTLFITSLAIHLHAELGEDFHKNAGCLQKELTEYPRARLQPYTYASGITVRVPITGDLCNNEPSLCSPGTDRDQYDLSLRGPTIGEGFRMRPKKGAAGPELPAN
jgi:hypothetical protein